MNISGVAINVNVCAGVSGSLGIFLLIILHNMLWQHAVWNQCSELGDVDVLLLPFCSSKVNHVAKEVSSVADLSHVDVLDGVGHVLIFACCASMEWRFKVLTLFLFLLSYGDDR